MPSVARQGDVIKRYTVYMLTSPTGKKYIGYTSNSVKWRMSFHRRQAEGGIKTAIGAAIRKYGFESMKVRTLRVFKTQQEALDYEVLSIKRHNTYGASGYNMTPGGEKPSEKFGGANWMRGKSKQAIASINRRKACPGEKNGFYGKTHSKANLKKAVATRRENGSYDDTAIAVRAKYKGRIYTSKKSLREAHNLSRLDVERLVARGEIDLRVKQPNALKTLSESKQIAIEYKGKTYKSMKNFMEEQDFASYKGVYKLLNQGLARRVSCLQ